MNKSKPSSYILWAIALLLLPLLLQSMGNAWVRIADMALLYVLLALPTSSIRKRNGKESAIFVDAEENN
jgi:hypothetical protein